MKRIEKAQKKKKAQELTIIEQTNNTNDLINAHKQEIETNPEYSLEVDPQNLYGLTDTQKIFIKYYVEYKNINIAASLAGIDADSAKAIFLSYSSQQEIRRINRALYQRAFTTKMIGLEQIGGYLTSLLIDENVPIADRLKTTDKLRVVQMIIDLNDYRRNAIDEPSLVTEKDIEQQVKSLSIDTIRQLLYTQNKDNISKDKEELIAQIDIDGLLSPEEIAYLKTLSTKDLLELVNSTNGGKKNE